MYVCMYCYDVDNDPSLSDVFQNLSQLGIDISAEDMAELGIGCIGVSNGDEDDEDDDESLEAELAALQGESRPKEKRKSEESHGKTLNTFYCDVLCVNLYSDFNSLKAECCPLMSRVAAMIGDSVG